MSTKFAYLPHFSTGLLVVDGPYITSITRHLILDIVSKGLNLKIDPRIKNYKDGTRQEVIFEIDDMIFLIKINLKSHPQIICSAVKKDGKGEMYNLGGYSLPDFSGPACAIIRKFGNFGVEESYKLGSSF
jgi:hypothetical protein